MTEARTFTIYEDQFPSEAGPPRVAEYTGKKVFKATQPHYLVELDSGAFRALWELLEAEAKYRFPVRETISGYMAYCRAVQSFRDAYWAQNSLPPPSSRRLKRPTGRPRTG